MGQAELRIERSGAIETLTLTRPAALNALTAGMVSDLLDYFSDLRRRTDVRVVVFRGEGEHFCSGLDIKQDMPVLKEGPAYAMNFMADFGEIVLRMRRCPQPIIAVLEGAASGAGMALALASDVRLALPGLKMNAAFIKLGLSGSEMGLSFLLQRIAGTGLASELMLTGRFIETEEARRTGLVSRVVQADELEKAVEAICEQLLATAPLGLRLTKEAINLSLAAPSLEAAIAIDNRNQSLGFVSRMPDEGVTAFREKRPPVYRDE